MQTRIWQATESLILGNKTIGNKQMKLFSQRWARLILFLSCKIKICQQKETHWEMDFKMSKNSWGSKLLQWIIQQALLTTMLCTLISSIGPLSLNVLLQCTINEG